MEIVLKSLISAVITGIILLIAKYVGPKLAGAIGGIPIVFAISYILITVENKSSANSFLIGGIYGAVAAIFFSLILILLNNKLPDYHRMNFIVSYVLCFLLVIGMIHFTAK